VYKGADPRGQNGNPGYDPAHYSQREPGKQDEWVVGYREGKKYAHCLVLGTNDISAVIGRFREEHPAAKVWAIEQAELDQGDESPMGGMSL
jgi:hypothetical protein